MSLAQEFTKGLWKELPPFKLVLGLCPTLAVTASADGGLGMGLATTFVLVCSNILISLLRKIIPDKVRIAAFIVIIASFVVIVEHVMQAYAYSLYKQLGVFIPLIVVNCIILGRAEAFASKRSVLESTLDGLGIGIGFTLSLTFLGTVREIIGKGMWFKMDIIGSWWTSFQPMEFIVKNPGAFICLGLVLGLINYISSRSKA